MGSKTDRKKKQMLFKFQRYLILLSFETEKLLVDPPTTTKKIMAISEIKLILLV